MGDRRRDQMQALGTLRQYIRTKKLGAQVGSEAHMHDGRRISMAISIRGTLFKPSVDWTISETYSFSVVYASPEKPRKHFLSPSVSKEERLPNSPDECEDIGAALMTSPLSITGRTAIVVVASSHKQTNAIYKWNPIVQTHSVYGMIYDRPRLR